MNNQENSQLAFVFPGQGSQSVGMMAGLAERHAEVRDTFVEAADVLGYDLWTLVSQGPSAELNRTECTQPALLAASTALWRLWNAAGGALPVMMAGHSLGEYSALVCAGSLQFDDGLRLVEARGRYMQQAVPAGSGAMAAILGLDDDAVEQVCAQAGRPSEVSAANYNSPGQVVIAGGREQVERAVVLAKEAGAKRAVTLEVSVPSHCALMSPAAERLKADLDRVELRPPAVPVYQNVGAAVADGVDGIKEALVSQLYSPVRWAGCIAAMAAGGATLMIEGGPGKVLSGLGRRIDKRITTLPSDNPDAFEKALAAAAND